MIFILYPFVSFFYAIIFLLVQYKYSVLILYYFPQLESLIKMLLPTRYTQISTYMYTCINKCYSTFSLFPVFDFSQVSIFRLENRIIKKHLGHLIKQKVDELSGCLFVVLHLICIYTSLLIYIIFYAYIISNKRAEILQNGIKCSKETVVCIIFCEIIIEHVHK